MGLTTTPVQPHCTRCGRHLAVPPANAYGWCDLCEVAARFAGLPQVPPNLYPVPYVPGPQPFPPSGYWPPIVWCGPNNSVGGPMQAQVSYSKTDSLN